MTVMVEDTLHARYIWRPEDIVAALKVIFPSGDFVIVVRFYFFCSSSISSRPTRLTISQESPTEAGSWKLRVPSELTEVSKIPGNRRINPTVIIPIDYAVYQEQRLFIQRTAAQAAKAREAREHEAQKGSTD